MINCHGADCYEKVLKIVLAKETVNLIQNIIHVPDVHENCCF